jgi:hypothetical protein
VSLHRLHPDSPGGSNSNGVGEEELAALLRQLETCLLDPVFRRDPERVGALLADDFQEFGSSGRVWRREQILELLSTEKFQPPVIEGFACRPMGAAAALVTYRTVRIDTETNSRTETLRSSLWTSETGEWRMRFHQGTRVLQGTGT